MQFNYINICPIHNKPFKEQIIIGHLFYENNSTNNQTSYQNLICEECRLEHYHSNPYGINNDIILIKYAPTYKQNCLINSILFLEEIYKFKNRYFMTLRYFNGWIDIEIFDSKDKKSLDYHINYNNYSNYNSLSRLHIVEEFRKYNLLSFA